MSYLLDTHVYIWLVMAPEKISDGLHSLLEQTASSIYVSAAVPWEIAIKQQVGKIEVPDNIMNYVDVAGLDFLDITPKHALTVSRLPMIHRDPFDRIMLAQAIAEDCTFVTVDAQCLSYQVKDLNMLNAKR